MNQTHNPIQIELVFLQECFVFNQVSALMDIATRTILALLITQQTLAAQLTIRLKTDTALKTLLVILKDSVFQSLT